MKQLIGNTLYFTGRYIMPVLGFIFNTITVLIFYNYSYFLFYHFNSLMVYYLLLDLEKRNLTIELMTNAETIYKIYDTKYTLDLWHDTCSISVHLEDECIVSGYSCTNWDKNLNNKIYNLFK